MAENKENKRNQDTNLGQQSNQDWDDANDQKTSGSSEPDPERYKDANLGQGEGKGSAFNERHQSTGGYGSSQRPDRENVGPLDADLNDLPSERRSGDNQTGPGLG